MRTEKEKFADDIMDVIRAALENPGLHSTEVAAMLVQFAAAIAVGAGNCPEEDFCLGCAAAFQAVNSLAVKHIFPSLSKTN